MGYRFANVRRNYVLRTFDGFHFLSSLVNGCECPRAQILSNLFRIGKQTMNPALERRQGRATHPCLGLGTSGVINLP
jgi:hypothetical protein